MVAFVYPCKQTTRIIFMINEFNQDADKIHNFYQIGSNCSDVIMIVRFALSITIYIYR